MDLEAIQLFAIVAREGSLQAAARTGSASRTTIRRKLYDLEEDVGVPLLVRGAQGIELTAAGEMLAHRAEELIQQLDLLAASAREIATNGPRPIRVLLPFGAPAHGHSLVFRALRQMWPEVRLEFCQDLMAGARGCMNYDICVSVLKNIPKGPYRIFEVLNVELCLVASPEFLRERAPITRVEDLAEHPLLVWEDPEDGVPPALHSRLGGSVPITPALVSNDIDVLHEMVAAGDGIGWTLHQDFTEVDRERFVRVLPDLVGEARSVHLLVSNAVADSPRIQLLLSAIAEFSRPI